MDIDGVSSGDNDADDSARLAAITERNHKIWDQLGNCHDEDVRNRLFEELSANRRELFRIKEAIVHQSDESNATARPSDPPPDPPESVGSKLRANLLAPEKSVVVPAAHSAQSTSNAIDLTPEDAPGGSNDTQASESTDPAHPRSEREAPRSVSPASPERAPGAASASAVNKARQPAHAADRGSDRVRSSSRRPALVLPILAAVGALAIAAWFVFPRAGDSPATAETDTTVAVAAEVTVVDQIRAVLDGLGHDSLLVEERSGTVYLAGVVASDGDRSTAVAATQALAGDMPLDSSGLTVQSANGSAAPPTSSASQTETPGEGQEPIAVPRVFDGPYIEATLDGKDFVLAGVVPSDELAASYLEAAEIAYAPYIRSELTVDDQLASPDWLSRGLQAIIMLPMITEGKILIAEDQVEMSGRSPNQAGIDRLQGALEDITGLPVAVGEVDITNLQPPSWVIAADAGAVELSGEVPTEEIRGLLAEAATAAYGSDNVKDQMTVNPNVYPSLWMYNGGPLMQAMSTFPDYELRINGTAFSGHINGNVSFESGSAVFSGNYAQVLDVGVGVLTRDQSLHLVIEGHTDDRGTKASNLALSQARAEAVRDYFIAHGIDPARLTAVGIGEAEPVVPNTSEAARARNRRIEYILTTSR